MKRILLGICLGLALTVSGYSQIVSNVPFNKTWTFNSVQASGSETIYTRGINIWKFSYTWRGSTAPTACTVALQSSTDNVNWSTQTSNDCTNSFSLPYLFFQAGYVRANMTAFTKGSADSYVDVNVVGFFGEEIASLYANNGSSGLTQVRTNVLNNNNSAVTTSQVIAGVLLVDKPGRFAVNSAPGAGTQGSASLTATAGQRHVIDCIGFSSSSTVAPALTSLAVNVRDGATGVGTQLASFYIAIPNTTGQNTPPIAFCGLNLAGSTNTATTVEWSASLTNLSQSVWFTGYNIN